MTKRKLELTAMPMPKGVLPRWRKKHNGKIYYFRGNYETALRAWHAKRTELETTETEDQPDYYRRQWERVRDWHREHGQVDDAEQVADQLKLWDDRALKLAWQGMSDGGRTVWAERFRVDEQPAKSTPATIGQAVESFLARAVVRVESGTYAPGYYDSLKRATNHFADFVGRRVGVGSINGHTLETYHTELERRIKDGWSKSYAAGFQRMVKIFVGWCYDTELLNSLPRNMRRGNTSLTIDIGKLKKPTFSNEEIKTLLDNATERTQLYILLALNCAMTQIDIAKLHPEQVDWAKGRITRQRTKTEGNENVPEVSYPLWTRTFELLKKHGCRKGERVLLNDEGRPLKVERLQGTDHKKIDNVSTAYNRLLVKLTTSKEEKGKKDKVQLQQKKIKPPLLKKTKPFKTFRKTSPSRLEDSEFASCARWFGGWSLKSVMDKHYLTPPRDLFDKAVRWLATSYGLEE
jgi:integrase